MKRTKKGIIVSTKMNKTVLVQVDRMVPHAKYGKPYRVSKRIPAHVDNDKLTIGDVVTIRESRPLSKTKHWIVENESGQKEGS
jgi:small subunit ribosomal protein S17